MATIVGWRRVSFSLATIAAIATTPAVAQCTTGFVPGAPMPGTNGDAYSATTWDPDGSGPLPMHIVVGGSFTVAGDCIADNIAYVDPGTGHWEPMGTGLSGPVRALTTTQNADVVAGGSFAFAGTTPVQGVARWNGSTWVPMGSGLGDGVRALLTMTNGDVIAGGTFTIAAGAPTDELARWNGTAWQAIGTPPSFYGVNALVESTSGTLLVASYSGVHEWNGVHWSTVGGATSPGATALTQMPNGDVLAGANAQVRRWNGVSWQNYGPSLIGIATLQALPNGGVLAGGYFGMSATQPRQLVAYGDGASWVGVATGWGEAHRILTTSNGDVYVAGTFSDLDGVPAWRIGRWRNGAWSALGPTCFDRDIVCALQTRNGDVVVAGGFSRTPDGPAWAIARWNGAQWSPLGAGSPWSFGYALAEMPNGDVVVAGGFGASALTPSLLRWNGTTWTPFGTASPSNGVWSLVVMPNGDLVAGGSFTSIDGQAAENIARWDGTAWHPLGNGLGSPSALSGVTTLTVLQNGDLLAAGVFDTAGGITVEGIARWDGSAWSTFGTATGAPSSRVIMKFANGDVLVQRGNHIVRWTGTQWIDLATGLVSVALELPDGDLLVCGNFVGVAGSVPVRGVARFDHTTWTPIGSLLGDHAYVAMLLTMPDGSIAAVGRFDAIASRVSPCFARMLSTCPAQNASFGNGCAGSSGTATLAASSLPWIGATWSVRATGLTNNAFAVRVLGFATQQVPLAPVLPLAAVGCDLLVTDDVLDLAFATNGVASASIAIPDAVSLVGLQLHQQMIPFALDALGNVVQITATNGVRGTVGVL